MRFQRRCCLKKLLTHAWTPDIEGSQKLTEHFVLRWAKNHQRAITPKGWCLELWFCARHFYSMRSICLWNFKLLAWIHFRVMLLTKFKNENEQREITPKVWSFELCFCALHFFSMKSIGLWNFKSVAWILLNICSRQNSRMKMNKGK